MNGTKTWIIRQSETESSRRNRILQGDGLGPAPISHHSGRSERPAEVAGKLAREVEDRLEQTPPGERGCQYTLQDGKFPPQILGAPLSNDPNHLGNPGFGRLEIIGWSNPKTRDLTVHLTPSRQWTLDQASNNAQSAESRPFTGSMNLCI